MSFTTRYLISEFLSVLGNGAAAVILPLILLAKTNDPLAAGTLSLICAMPQFLSGLFGGAFLDVYNRRTIAICADCISALSVAMLPVVEMTVGLHFGWFVFFGIIGAIGDIPGMTARDVLFPSLVAQDGKNLQQALAICQAVDSLAVIVGPALASVLIHLGGAINGLWATAALSLAAAIATSTLPKNLFQPPSPSEVPQKPFAIVGDALNKGLSIVFHNKQILAILLLSTGIGIVISGFQGLVLPVYFTELGTPERLGVVLSALATGTLVGPLSYAALAQQLSARRWYVLSLLGSGIGVAILALLPRYSLLLLGAFLTGALCGPLSSLLSMQLLHHIPEEKRGAVFGLQNAAQLITMPTGLFVVSIAVKAFGTANAAFILGGFFWLSVVWALTTPTLRQIDQSPYEENARPITDEQ